MIELVFQVFHKKSPEHLSYYLMFIPIKYPLNLGRLTLIKELYQVCKKLPYYIKKMYEKYFLFQLDAYQGFGSK